MSGLEIAGLVVGAPPLIFYVLDNYRRALRPLKRFQHYQTYLASLNANVSTSNVTFRNAIEVLLTAVFSKDEARCMMSDLYHRAWRDQEAERALKGYLQGNYEPVLQEINEISSIISPLLKQIPDSDVADEKKPKRSPRRKAEILFQRLSCCFKEEQFNYAMSRASSRIETLRALIAHPQQLEEAEENCQKRQQRYTALDGAMRAFDVVKQSSKALFDTVQRCCVDHQTHFVYFGLDPEIRDDRLAHISFDLQYGQMTTSKLSPNHSTNFILKVESSLRSEPVEFTMTTTTSSTRTSEAAGVTNSQLERVATSLSLPSQCKRVKLDEPYPCSNDFEPQSTVNLPDFLSQSNLCDWLSQRLATRPIMDKEYIGCVDRNTRCQFRFHVRRNPFPDVVMPISLQGLFEKISNGRAMHPLPYGKKFRYARILACGVMRFYGTPWLPNDRLHGKNILLCGLDPSLDFYDMALPDPSINIPISTSTHLESYESEAHDFIRNLLVFRLGIMLTELALGQSIADLQCNAEKEKGELEGQKAAAERMLAAVGRATHPRYQDVVRKCLRTYAAEDTLSACDDKHRKKFHDDIIAELHDMEVRFNKLDMG